MANYHTLLIRAELFECGARQVKKQADELKQQANELKRRFIDQFIIGTEWDKQHAEWIKHYTQWNICCNSQIIERSNQLSERAELLKIAPRDMSLHHIEIRDSIGNPLFDQITQISNELKQLAYELNQQAKWVKQLVDQRAEQAQTIKQLSTHIVELDKQLKQQSEQLDQHANQLAEQAQWIKQYHTKTLTVNQLHTQLTEQDQMIGNLSTQITDIQPDLLQLSDLYHEQQSKSNKLEAELQCKNSQLSEQEDNMKQLLVALEAHQSKQGLASTISSYFK